MLLIPWREAQRRGKTAKFPLDGSISKCDCPGGAPRRGFACRVPGVMTHSPRQLSLEPRFRFLVHPIPIKYFQGFHSGNGKHEVVRGTISSSRKEISMFSSSFPGNSSSPFKGLNGAGMLTFPMSHSYLGSRAARPCLCLALPPPSVIPR